MNKKVKLAYAMLIGRQSYTEDIVADLSTAECHDVFNFLNEMDVGHIPFFGETWKRK